jgi:hypothetical protein
MYKKNVRLGKFSHGELDRIIRESSLIRDAGSRIGFLSELFLDIDYAEHTLTDGGGIHEAFVVNLEGVDCFTFIDYVEAMRLSDSYSEFELRLKSVRYRSGWVSFEGRNHFFTDWREFSPHVYDATREIADLSTVTVFKRLNEKGDGKYFIPGIRPVGREISYIPSDAIAESVLERLRTGDYAGIYSPLPGLDVSHAGIIVIHGERILFRHASSQKKYRKVVDQDFMDYMAGKPGLIVLRPKSQRELPLEELNPLKNDAV